MSTAQQQTPVLTGTWVTEPVHSSLQFSVRHMVVATFRGLVPDFTATLVADGDGGFALEGTARPGSIVTRDANLTGHLMSPDFFDAERYPEATFRSTGVVREGDDQVTVQGELTLKGVTRPLTLHGTIEGPQDTPAGERVGLELAGTIDRTEFGLGWNMELPGGGLVAGHQVRLSAFIELIRES